MKLKQGQQAFIEITNPIHGGEGWHLGYALWSPTRNKAGADRWSSMREVKPGDIIIHSVKNKGSLYRFFGISTAKTSYLETDVEPLIPGRYAKEKGYKAYYKVLLTNYRSFDKTPYVKDFLEKYRSQLSKYHGSFFDRDSMYIVQKYLVKLDEEIFDMIIEYLESQDTQIPQQADTQDVFSEGEDYHLPGKVKYVSERVIRDTKIVNDLKEKYNHKCQICGKTIVLPSGKLYSEGHHIKPLSGVHRGPDVKNNIIIVCPTHHIEFDYGAIAIDPNTNLIIHIDHNNEFHGKNLSYTRKDINKEFIKYHHKNIFSK